MMLLIIEVIKIVLRNEGYSNKQIKTAINYSYTEIKDFIDNYMTMVETFNKESEV